MLTTTTRQTMPDQSLSARQTSTMLIDPLRLALPVITCTLRHTNSILSVAILLFLTGCPKQGHILPPPAEIVELRKADHRALFVAINDYPNAPLRGCVNDATDWQAYLKTKGWTDDQFMVLLNEKATRAEIIKGLKWLTSNSAAGDNRVFVFSGHGIEYSGSTANVQFYGVNQAICPFDFEWREDRMLLDTDLIGFFRAFAKGVDFLWVSDSCHSGDLSRGLIRGTPKVYPVQPLQVRANVITAKNKPKKTMNRDLLNVGFVSGCQYNQTSADSWFNNRPNGALSYFFLQELYKSDALPLKDAVDAARKALAADRYDQEPQCEGALRNKPVVDFVKIQ